MQRNCKIAASKEGGSNRKTGEIAIIAPVANGAFSKDTKFILANL